jgi:hypothetical protein
LSSCWFAVRNVAPLQDACDCGFIGGVRLACRGTRIVIFNTVNLHAGELVLSFASGFDHGSLVPACLAQAAFGARRDGGGAGVLGARTGCAWLACGCRQCFAARGYCAFGAGCSAYFKTESNPAHRRVVGSRCLEPIIVVRASNLIVVLVKNIAVAVAQSA